MIVYKELEFHKGYIVNLYLNNNWYAYTNDRESLFRGIENSLDCYAAYDDKKLVGLIRTIGDGETIVYIQDILVMEKYHRQKIGTTLMNYILDKYKNVRQICLMTDLEESQRKFYESCGFIDYKTAKAVGYLRKK